MLLSEEAGMALYKNNKTGVIIDFTSKVEGADWQPVDKVASKRSAASRAKDASAPSADTLPEQPDEAEQAE
jgi:hypothetical protein